MQVIINANCLNQRTLSENGQVLFRLRFQFGFSKNKFLHQKYKKEIKKIGSFSLIERVILSAGAMLIFSVSFQIDQMPEGREICLD